MPDDDKDKEKEKQKEEALTVAKTVAGLGSGAVEGLLSKKSSLGDSLKKGGTKSVSKGVGDWATKELVGAGLKDNPLESTVAGLAGGAAKSLVELGLKEGIGWIEEQLKGKPSLPEVSYSFTEPAGTAWQVRRLHMSEALSEPFLCSIDLVTEELGVKTDELLGVDVELTMERAAEHSSVLRSIYGIVHLVEFIGVTMERLQIRVEVVPALYLLDQRVDTRLWQNATVPTVLKEVLEAALGEYDRKLDVAGIKGSYTEREYIVQYHESDLDFAQRLMEEEGITYWFKHDPSTNREVLQLFDDNGSFTDIDTLSDDPKLTIVTDREDYVEYESLQHLDYTRELTPTTVHQRRFNWLEPTVPELSTAPKPGQSKTGPQGRVREVYRHGRYEQQHSSEPRTIRRLVHHRQRDEVVRGYGNVVGFTPGCKFAVDGHQRSDLNQTYMLRRITHSADCPEVMKGEERVGPNYANRYEAQIFDTAKPYRPPPVTPRPRIYGPQTALVTGPEGEEIHTDNHGRIKVLFDWDRVHSMTDDSSMWIRVAHNWAGPGFGTFFVPRIGMEVVVEFIEGDPARPLVVGCVYNGDNDVSISLPADKTQSTIRTRSSPGSEGFNELRFEDAAGSEEVFLHAQKNLREKVLNNHSTSVGADQSNSVGGSQTQTVKVDQSETISGKQTMKVEKTRDKEIIQDETNKLRANRTSTVDLDDKLTVTGTTTITSGKTMTVVAQSDYIQTVGGKSSIAINAGKAGPGDGSLVAANNFYLDGKKEVWITQDWKSSIKMHGGDAYYATQGNCIIGSKLDTQISSETANLLGSAATKVQFSQGGATITIEGGKVAISASEITLASKANSIKIDGAGVTVSGAKVDVAAQGVATVTGALVKVN